MFVVTHRIIFYIFSGILLAASVVFLLIWGLNLGIDFSGGSILEASYIGERPSVDDIKNNLEALGVGSAIIQYTGEKGLIVRMRNLSEEEHQAVLFALAGGSDYTKVLQELRFDSIGPTIGSELRRKSIYAMILVLIMILLFITWSFRKVSRPVASWKYGIVAILALIHDVLIPSGVFALLGKFLHVEADTLFVTALLTILGFSVHDTIVVFDRIRENVKKIGSAIPFEEVVGKSLNQVMGRSIATSFAVFIVLLALFIFGESSTRYFALTLIVGIIAGTYSSIFLASPFIVTWYKFSLRKGK